MSNMRMPGRKRIERGREEDGKKEETKLYI